MHGATFCGFWAHLVASLPDLWRVLGGALAKFFAFPMILELILLCSCASPPLLCSPVCVCMAGATKSQI